MIAFVLSMAAVAFAAGPVAASDGPCCYSNMSIQLG